jgi:hypothetical protein
MTQTARRRVRRKVRTRAGQRVAVLKLLLAADVPLRKADVYDRLGVPSGDMTTRRALHDLVADGDAAQVERWWFVRAQAGVADPELARQAFALAHPPPPPVPPPEPRRRCSLCGEPIADDRPERTRFCDDLCCAEAARVRWLLEGSRGSPVQSLASMLAGTRRGALGRVIAHAGLERRDELRAGGDNGAGP